MPENDVQFVNRSEILDFEEIERFARIAVSLGVTKLRVTGGEPLVRRDLPLLIRRLAAIPGIRDLALTTNGVLLPELARAALRRRAAAHQRPPGYARPRPLPRRSPAATISTKCSHGLALPRAAGLPPSS